MFSIEKSFWFVYGSFTRTSVDIVPTRISARFLALTMWTATLLIITAYVAGNNNFNYTSIWFLYLFVPRTFIYHKLNRIFGI